MRGKLSLKARGSTCKRLIPACAGKTSVANARHYIQRAHPRVCGENSLVSARNSASRGSSPRVRGKRYGSPLPAHKDRLIPACAGKTGGVRGVSCDGGAHPRVCGENGVPGADNTKIEGSSPRVRGKPSCRLSPQNRPRLIPACAGKTRDNADAASVARAHPRVCGENVAWSSREMMCSGSSPRVRGKLHRVFPGLVWPGLIPACAGKT